jgi:hypothetical protein
MYSERQCWGSESAIRWFFDPWIRDPGSGMINPDHISVSLETIFGVKKLKFLMRIRDAKRLDPEWKKFGSGIRNKYPGSSTLVKKCIL